MVPLKELGPVPLIDTPGIPFARESLTDASSEPLLGTTEPFGGETTLLTVTGGRVPMLAQVTVDLT